MFFYKVLSHVSGRNPLPKLTSLSFTKAPTLPHLLQSLTFTPSPISQQVQVNLLCPPMNSSISRFGFSSSASTETNERKKWNNVHNGDSPNDDPAKTSEETKEFDQAGQAKHADQIEESDSGSELDLSRDDLIERVVEKEELLKLKHKEIEKMQDKVLGTYAEMENVMDRTRRELENSKKFAIKDMIQSSEEEKSTHGEGESHEENMSSPNMESGKQETMEGTVNGSEMEMETQSEGESHEDNEEPELPPRTRQPPVYLGDYYCHAANN